MKIIIRALFFLLITMIVSCDHNEDNFIQNFESMNEEKLDTSQYKFLKTSLVPTLKQFISYKFKDGTITSFVGGKDFTLLSFSLNANKSNNIKSVKIILGESKVNTTKWYTFCGFEGRKLTFRPKNNPIIPQPILRLDTDKIIKKVVNSKFIFVEGNIKNLGIYLGNQEYIFMPYDNAITTQKEDLYMKVLIVDNKNSWVVYIFYSKQKIKTKVLKGLRV